MRIYIHIDMDVYVWVWDWHNYKWTCKHVFPKDSLEFAFREIDTSTNWNHLKSSGAGRSLFSEWINNRFRDGELKNKKSIRKGRIRAREWEIRKKYQTLKIYTNTTLSYKKNTPQQNFFQSTFHCHDIIQLSFSFYCIHFILFYLLHILFDLFRPLFIHILFFIRFTIQE